MRLSKCRFRTCPLTQTHWDTWVANPTGGGNKTFYKEYLKDIVFPAFRATAEAKTCLDSIPTLTALASKQGFLEEKNFADAGLWQTEEEKEAEEKNPRDDLALYRQRAILLTSAGFKRTAERKKCLKRAC